MKKLTHILLGSCLLTAFASCNDFLDTTPKGLVIPQKVEDFKGMIIDVSSTNTAYPLANICSDDVLYLEPTANSSTTNAYLWLEDFYKESESDEAWNANYEEIYKMNVVIANIMGATEGTQEEKEELLVEAKVSRAYMFWYLQSLYAKAYDPATASTDLSVPLPLVPDLEAKLPRSTVEQVTAQILDDLKDAENYMPEIAYNNYRPTKASVHGLRARIYFYMGRYDDAATEAGKALAYNNKLEDMRTWSFKDEAKPTAGVNNKPLNTYESAEKIWYRGTGFETMLASMCISDDLQALYGSKKDLRFKFWFSNIARDGDPWEDGHDRYLSELDYNIGVPEMMLIQAEALARKNDASCLDILNELRKYRFADADYRPLTAADGTSLLTIVLDERRRELPLGGLRWLDMKRLCKEGLYTRTLEREFEGTTYRLEPNSNRYVFPISRQVLNMNSNITQNPR